MNGALATPYALAMLAGILLIFFALRGFDEKHNLLGGKLSNYGAGPSKPSSPSGPPATGGTA